MGAGINHHRNDSNDSIYMRIPIPSYTHLKESVLKADSGSSSAAAAAARKSSGKPQLKQQLVGAFGWCLSHPPEKYQIGHCGSRSQVYS